MPNARARLFNEVMDHIGIVAPEFVPRPQLPEAAPRPLAQLAPTGANVGVEPPQAAVRRQGNSARAAACSHSCPLHCV